MASETNLLNELLVEIHRSLTQYVHEAGTWSAAPGCPMHQAVIALGQLQETDAQKLYQLLLNRGGRPDLGMYPADYTSLHFVSLDYLWPRLIMNQRGIVDLLDQALAQLSPASSALPTVREIARSQREGLASLNGVPAAPTQATIAVAGTAAT